MIPMRLIFRSRWAALGWSALLCWQAVDFVGGDKKQPAVDAANSADSNLAQLAAAAAEDD